MRTSVRGWEEVEEETKIEVPKAEGSMLFYGMRRSPVKRTSKGREVGESALSTNKPQRR